jgi:hypothetical protein
MGVVVAPKKKIRLTGSRSARPCTGKEAYRGGVQRQVLVLIRAGAVFASSMTLGI